MQPGGDIARRRLFRNNTTGAVDVVSPAISGRHEPRADRSALSAGNV